MSLNVDAETRRLKSDFNLHPVVGCEIEFYLHGSDACDMPAFWQEVSTRCKDAGISIYKIEKERGAEQHEVALAPTHPEKAAADMAALKNLLIEIAPKYGMPADFAAKPDDAQPGSGLHVHIHLTDAAGNNMFIKTDDAMSEPLAFSIGGLLTWLPASMPIFAPTEASYKRFVKSDNTPLTVSWGANNRTVAVRLPDMMPANKHIEHRVACADADPHQVVAVLLAAIHYGLKHQCEPGPQIYGDASLPMYKLPHFPHTLAEAQKQMQESGFLIEITAG